jgi:hypothetical protein
LRLHVVEPNAAVSARSRPKDYLSAPAPQAPAKATAKASAAAVLTADAREWCLPFEYRQGSRAFEDCLARWARAERFQTQQLRAADQAEVK